MNLEMTPWRDETGEIAGVVSAAHDVTETVEAMRSLERTQQRLQLATEMANLQVYDIDYSAARSSAAGKTLFPISEANDKAVAEAVFSGGTERFVDPRDRDAGRRGVAPLPQGGRALRRSSTACCVQTARSSGSPR